MNNEIEKPIIVDNCPEIKVGQLAIVPIYPDGFFIGGKYVFHKSNEFESYSFKPFPPLSQYRFKTYEDAEEAYQNYKKSKNKEIQEREDFYAKNKVKVLSDLY